MNYIIDYYFDLQTIDNENVVDILKNIIDSNNISNEPLDYQFEILDNENESIIFKGGEPTTTIPYRYFEEVADYLTHRKREAEEERISFLDSLFKPTKPTEEEVEVSTDVSEPTPPIIEESLSQQPPTMEESLPLEPPPIIEESLPQQPPTIIEESLPQQPTQPIMEEPLPPQPTMEEPLPPQEPPTMEEPLPPQPTIEESLPLELPTIEEPLPLEPPTIEEPLPQQPTQPIMEEPLPPQQPTIMEEPLPPQQAPMNNQIYKGGNVKSSIITVRIIIQKMKSLPFLFLKKMRYNPPK